MSEIRSVARKAVYNAVDREREYQDEKIFRKGWKKDKSVGEFILIMEEELREAKKGWLKNGDRRALEEILQVVAAGVACMEINGISEEQRDE